MYRPFQKLSHYLIQFWRHQVTPKLVPLLSVVWIAGLSIAGLALWGFAQLADEVMEQETQSFDQGILLALQRLHTPLLDQLVLGITFLGDPLVLGILSLCFGAILLLRQRWTECITLAIATGGAIGLNLWLKTLFARDRPQLWEHVVDVKYYSFPSGHAMVSFVIYGLLGYWLAARFPRYRSLIILGTTLLIGAIGLTRLYLGVHWPTDVIAGYAAGLVWLTTCILTLEIAWKRRLATSYTNKQSSRHLTDSRRR
jgi:membrane-associated phospholipid phosphatase